jgi:hypothetical protein
MVEIAQIWNAVLAPFANQVGMQGVAYGLLGFKTLRKVIELVRSFTSGSGGVQNESE